MRFLSPPVLVGDRICRIVSPIASLIEVEEWVGAWWEPSAVTITTASQAPAVPAEILVARGVPPEDQRPESLAPLEDVQSLLRASAAPYTQPLAVDPSSERRTNGSRRRLYSGNSRFRHGKGSGGNGSADVAKRDGGASEWTGPWRRATDDPSSQGPSAR